MLIVGGVELVAILGLKKGKKKTLRWLFTNGACTLNYVSYGMCTYCVRQQQLLPLVILEASFTSDPRLALQIEANSHLYSYRVHR